MKYPKELLIVTLLS